MYIKNRAAKYRDTFQKTLSLNAPLTNGDSECTFEEFIASRLYYSNEEQSEIKDAILKAIQKLDVKERSVIVDSIVNGKSLKDISSKYAITELSARKILYKAKNKLATELINFSYAY